MISSISPSPVCTAYPPRSTSTSIQTFSSLIHCSLIPSSVPSYFCLQCFLSLFPPSPGRECHTLDSVTVGEGRRKTQRDCIVVCSYLIINPHWSVSTPGPLFPLHSTAPSDKVAGWLVAGHGGLVYINNSETASQQRGWSYITINLQQRRDGFDSRKTSHHWNPSFNVSDFTALRSFRQMILNSVNLGFKIREQKLLFLRVKMQPLYFCFFLTAFYHSTLTVCMDVYIFIVEK